MRSLGTSLRTVVIAAATILLIGPVAAVALAELGGENENTDPIGTATPTPTATAGPLTYEDLLGPDVTEGVVGGQNVPSEGAHNWPVAPPIPRPEISVALSTSEGLAALASEPAVGEVAALVEARTAAGLVELMRSSTNAEGREPIVRLDYGWMAAATMEGLLERAFALNPEPAMGLRTSDGERWRLYYELDGAIDLDGLDTGFGDTPLTGLWLLVEPRADEPLSAIGFWTDIRDAVLVRILEQVSDEEGQQVLLFPATLDEIPGWTGYEWSRTRPQPEE